MAYTRAARTFVSLFATRIEIEAQFRAVKIMSPREAEIILVALQRILREPDRKLNCGSGR